MKAFIKDMLLVLISIAFIAMGGFILFVKQDVPFEIWFGFIFFGLCLWVHLSVFIRNLKDNVYGLNRPKTMNHDILDDTPFF